jgi:hypothetical protein
MAAFLPFSAGTANAIVEGEWVVVVAAAAACRRRRWWWWWWWWWLLSPMQNSLFHVVKTGSMSYQEAYEMIKARRRDRLGHRRYPFPQSPQSKRS